jgi:hypothetical protein
VRKNVHVWNSLQALGTAATQCARVVTSRTTFLLRAAGFLAAAAGRLGAAAAAVPSPEPLWKGDGRMRCTLPCSKSSVRLLTMSHVMSEAYAELTAMLLHTS